MAVGPSCVEDEHQTFERYPAICERERNHL